MAHKGMPYRVARAVGDRGEEIAVAHVREQGVHVVARNWRCAQGEIDIIGLDGDVVVFYEVKTRRSARFGSPAEAVTSTKAARLRRLALRWLCEHPRSEAEIRIDVVAITLSEPGVVDVEHLQAVA